MRTLRLVLMAFCLLVAVPASGAEVKPSPPRGFVKVDVLDAGLWPHGVIAVSAGKVTVVLDHVRFGVALADGYSSPAGEVSWLSGDMLLPVHVGYSLRSNPKKTWFCYAFVPDIYAEASGSLLRDPGVRLALCCDIDYYGLGIGIEGGWANYLERYSGFWFPSRAPRRVSFF